MRLPKLLACLAIAACLPLLPAHAAYPDHPIKLIVPSSPGGSADARARIVASRLDVTLTYALGR
jgi:tripartite-type tricarboxylate transporter receptor subunit TctC